MRRDLLAPCPGCKRTVSADAGHALCRECEGYPPRHPITGRFMANDCEIDCLDHCAGLCGAQHAASGDGGAA